MLATMAVGGDAMVDGVNKFNRVINLGHELSSWFEAEFGSTQCWALTRCDFASTEDVVDYIDRDGTADCARMAQRVAERVSIIVERASLSSSHVDPGPP
jgi:hypothetical protein